MAAGKAGFATDCSQINDVECAGVMLSREAGAEAEREWELDLVDDEKAYLQSKCTCMHLSLGRSFSGARLVWVAFHVKKPSHEATELAATPFFDLKFGS
jgi:hypothetical protein